MKWLAATVGFRADAGAGEIAMEVVADLFYRLGLKGVVIEDEPDSGEKSFASITGYFSYDASVEAKQRRLQSLADDLGAQGVIQCTVTYRKIDEEDWAHSWKEHFYPQKVGRHIVVKPTWRDYKAGRDDIVIEIDPGMAFGTGTHGTTRMCLVMLERHLKEGMTFLDVGTGSGILLIAAFKLGAGVVCGVDNDPVAVETARGNLALNRLKAGRAGVLMSDLVDGVTGTFDMVCANILTEVVMDLIPVVKNVLAPGGLFICSGIIASKASGVEELLRRFGFRLVDQMKDEEWTCLAAAL